MFRRNFVASALPVCSSRAGSRASAAADAARTEDLVKQAVERYDAGPRRRAGTGAAQTRRGRRGHVVPLTLEDAVRRALDNNLEIAVERLNPQTFDFSLASLRANYKPIATSTFGRRDNVRPPTNLLNPGSPNVSTMTYNAGVTQNLAVGRRRLALDLQQLARSSRQPTSWRRSIPSSTARTSSATRSRCCGDSRSTRRASRCRRRVINRDNAELNLKARTTNTLAAVRSAYWDYVFAIQAIDVAQQSLSLASKLLSDNKIRVEVGTMAPMDVVQAEAEEATRQQTLTTATATMRTAELSLKRLIVSGTNDPLWAQHIDPIDRPDFQPAAIDVEGAVRTALQQRTDLQIARNNLESNNVLLKSQRNSSAARRRRAASPTARPALAARSTTSPAAASTACARASPCNGGYDDSLAHAASTATIPTGSSRSTSAIRSAATPPRRRPRARRLLMQQNQAQIRATELHRRHRSDQRRAAGDQQHGSAGRGARARELSQRRLDAEMSRFEVGMSNNYQVVQSQRDLREAQNSELRALLNYRKSLVEFDRVQQAGAR